MVETEKKNQYLGALCLTILALITALSVSLATILSIYAGLYTLIAFIVLLALGSAIFARLFPTYRPHALGYFILTAIFIVEFLGVWILWTVF
jgi:hypothetical protein